MLGVNLLPVGYGTETMPFLTCQDCGSTDLREKSNGKYECKKCGYEGRKDDFISLA